MAVERDLPSAVLLVRKKSLAHKKPPYGKPLTAGVSGMKYSVRR